MRKPVTALAGLLLGALVWTACSTDGSPSVTDPSLIDGPALTTGTQHCPDGGKKTEVNDGFTYATKYFPHKVGKVCVKAGTKVYSTTYDGKFGYGCYKVWGLGTYKVTIKETGYAGCKDISYFVFYKKTYSY
jgi:hypothetical protein